MTRFPSQPFLCPLLLLVACGRSVAPVCNLDQALEVAAPDDWVPVLVELEPSPEPASLVSPRASRLLRRAGLVSALRAGAASAQWPVLEELERRGAVDLRPLWIVDAIAARVRPALARVLADIPGVRSVKLDVSLRAPRAALGAPAAGEWNLVAVHAPSLWSRGFDGNGVVVANMDTGVDLAHPDLQPRWRGGMHSWWDPYRSTATPYDVIGHGTQTMGVLVGGTAGGTAIGVAPGAQWIAAKVYDDMGNTTLSTLHQAFQWLLEPSGNADAPEAPDVVNASWGLASVGSCDTTFEPDLQALRAAGILVVFAAGNYGPTPETSMSPANGPSGYAAGAVDSSLTVDTSSSRGPSPCTSRVFPDVVAPGVDVRTADRSLAGMARFASVSGTSIAAPHVAGVAALLLGALPSTPVADLEDAIRNTARDLGVSGPDDATGHGLLDADAAYLALAGNAPLRITTAAVGPALEGIPFSAQLRAVGGIAPYTWSLAAGAFPPGVGLAPGGLLSGVATVPGSYPFTVAVQASTGSPVTGALTLEVTAPTLTITTDAVARGKMGQSYSEQLSAVGGTPPYRWALSLVSCATPLPPGLALDPLSGLISGTPTARGTYGFVARVNDTASGAANRTFSMTID
jgi:subtilisin family serine protease